MSGGAPSADRPAADRTAELAAQLEGEPVELRSDPEARDRYARDQSPFRRPPSGCT